MKNDKFIKLLILFYSFTGNTQYIAQMIQEEIGGELAQIETIKPYTGTDDSIDEQTKHEVDLCQKSNQFRKIYQLIIPS